MKKVYTAIGPTQAHVVKDLLELEGIEAVVQGEEVFSALGGVPFSYPSVWIANDEDLEHAEEVIADFEYDEGADRATWVCPDCGEEHEQQFDVCWSCGAERPEKNRSKPANDTLQQEGVDET